MLKPNVSDDFASWRFEIPGQPPSWNDSYRIVRQYRATRTGTRVPYHTLAKKQNVVDYQTAARLIIRSAMPSGWSPPGQVRVLYWLYLSRDMDCDNIMKAIHDAIQMATGVDDKRFLPCVMTKEVVPKPLARVEVVVAGPASLSVDPAP